MVSHTARISASDTLLGRLAFACSSTLAPSIRPTCEIAAFWTSTSSRPNSQRMRCAAAATEAWSAHIELERPGVVFDRPGRRLAAREIARSHQHGETVACQILRDLKTDSLIGPGDQSDGFVLHDHLP